MRFFLIAELCMVLIAFMLGLVFGFDSGYVTNTLLYAVLMSASGIWWMVYDVKERQA